VTYLRRNVTVVCGASYHLLGSRISQDSRIRYQLQVKSYISNWQFSQLQHLARYVSCRNDMAYDTWKCLLPHSHIHCLLRPSRPMGLWFSQYRGAALPLLLKCVMGGHLLARSGWCRRCVVFTSCCIALFWGAWPPLRPTPTVCPSSPALPVGNVPNNYGGFFHTTLPHDLGYFHHGHVDGGPPAHHWGHPYAQVSLSVHGGRHAPSRDVPSFVYDGGTFPQGHRGYLRIATLVAPSLAFAGLSLRLSLPQEDRCSSSGSDITMSFSSPGQGLPPPLLSYHPRASGGSFHLLPHLVLLPPHLLRQMCSSSIPSRT
jgi:hypothetical protein